MPRKRKRKRKRKKNKKHTTNSPRHALMFPNTGASPKHHITNPSPPSSKKPTPQQIPSTNIVRKPWKIRFTHGKWRNKDFEDALEALPPGDDLCAYYCLDVDKTENDIMVLLLYWGLGTQLDIMETSQWNTRESWQNINYVHLIDMGFTSNEIRHFMTCYDSQFGSHADNDTAGIVSEIVCICGAALKLTVASKAYGDVYYYEYEDEREIEILGCSRCDDEIDNMDAVYHCDRDSRRDSLFSEKIHRDGYVLCEDCLEYRTKFSSKTDPRHQEIHTLSSMKRKREFISDAVADTPAAVAMDLSMSDCGRHILVDPRHFPDWEYNNPFLNNPDYYHPPIVAQFGQHFYVKRNYQPSPHECAPTAVIPPRDDWYYRNIIFDELGIDYSVPDTESDEDDEDSDRYPNVTERLDSIETTQISDEQYIEYLRLKMDRDQVNASDLFKRLDELEHDIEKKMAMQTHDPECKYSQGPALLSSPTAVNSLKSKSSGDANVQVDDNMKSFSYQQRLQYHQYMRKSAMNLRTPQSAVQPPNLFSSVVFVNTDIQHINQKGNGLTAGEATQDT